MAGEGLAVDEQHCFLVDLGPECGGANPGEGRFGIGDGEGSLQALHPPFGPESLTTGGGGHRVARSPQVDQTRPGISDGVGGHLGRRLCRGARRQYRLEDRDGAVGAQVDVAEHPVAVGGDQAQPA